MAYEASFSPSYPQWHDKPTEDTPVNAAVLTNYDTAIQTIEGFLDGSTAVNPDSKVNTMTSPVGVDSNGKLWSVPGGSSGGGSADGITYDNTDSGLSATNVQDAIDEVASAGGGGTAASITYDNTSSGLLADDVQEAIDAVNEKVGDKVSAVSKTSAMTQSVGIDSNGELWTEPGGGSSTFTSLTVGSRKTGSSIGTNSVAEGNGNEASGNYSHAEGDGTTVIAPRGHAEGLNTEVGTTDPTWGDIVGAGAHAEGNSTKAYGNYSHAEGSYTTVAIAAYNGHAEGSYTTASGLNSHAEGVDTTASGQCSHASGYYTTAASDNQFVCGKFNNNSSSNLFEVGNGETTSSRSNAFEVRSNGSVKIKTQIDCDTATTLSDSDYVYILVSGAIKKITLANLKTVLGL